MATTADQNNPCPVCKGKNRAVRLSAAYQSGLVPYGPPPMPGKKVGMMSLLTIGMVVVGICVFLIIVFVGSESFGFGIAPLEVVLVAVTLIGIITALVLSFMAFTRVMQGDLEAQKHYPAWDRALAIYNHLYYCPQDNVVYDPQTGKAVTAQQLNSLLETEEQQEQVQSALAHK
jgi:hypothetical protein